MLHALVTVVQEAAANEAAGSSIGLIGAGLAIGGAVLGAGLGIGPIGSAAAQGIARQPEATAQIQTAAGAALGDTCRSTVTFVSTSTMRAPSEKRAR